MRFTLLLLAVAVCTATTQAQEDVLRPEGRPDDGTRGSTSSTSTQPFIIGLEAGANFNFYGQTIEGTWDESPYNAFGTGFGVSPLVGIYLDLPVSSTIGIGLRVLYDAKSFGNTQDEALLDCFIEGQGYTVAPISVEYTETVSYVTLNPTIRWQATPQLFVHAGPVLQFAAGQLTNTTTYSVDESEDCRFFYGTPDESTTLVTEGSADADPATRFGLDLGVGFRIPLSSAIDLVPRLGYQWMFSPYNQDVDFVDDSRANTIGSTNASASSSSLNSLQLSLSLWFNL